MIKKTLLVSFLLVFNMCIVAFAQITEKEIADTRRFAIEGDAQAQYVLGQIYFSGNGVPANIEEAVKWWMKAAEQGSKPAKKFIAKINHSK